MNRVVITGIGAVTAFGKTWPEIQAAMLRYENAVRYMPEWREVTDLNAKLGAPVDGYHPPRTLDAQTAAQLGARLTNVR